MTAKTVKMREFEQLVRSWNCTARKTTKEWEVIDNLDGKWICGFATVSGREVKVSYVRNFTKQIQEKRNDEKAAKKKASTRKRDSK
jgi:hypothetical protein